MKKLRPLVKIHGGKFYLSDFVVEHFPSGYQQMEYLEPFGGAASVLLRKAPSHIEIYNDLDESIVNIFYCLKNHPDYIIRRLNSIDYNEESFSLAINSKFSEEKERAVAEIVARRMSRGGLKKAFSWSDRLRGGIPGDVNAWITFRNQLPEIATRIKDITIECQEGIDLITKWDKDNTLIYCDPPYLPSSRTVKKAYKYEMSEKHHRQFIDTIKQVKGKVIISGYYTNLYSKAFADWNMKAKEMPNHSAQSKSKERRLEVLWFNY